MYALNSARAATLMVIVPAVTQDTGVEQVLANIKLNSNRCRSESFAVGEISGNGEKLRTNGMKNN